MTLNYNILNIYMYAEEPKYDKLTKRELEVLALIVKEYNSKQIAECLFISPRTVESHRKNMYKKIGAKTIIGLVKFAIENKLVFSDKLKKTIS